MRELGDSDLESTIGGVFEDSAYSEEPTGDGGGGVAPDANHLEMGEGRGTYTGTSTNTTLPWWFKY